MNGAYFGPQCDNDMVWNGYVQKFGTEYPPGVGTGLCDAFTRAVSATDDERKIDDDGNPTGERAVLMFALGYSGTGKTFTIQGAKEGTDDDGKVRPAQPGMVSRAAKLQMEAAQKRSSGKGVVVVLSCIELVLASNDMTDRTKMLRGTLLQYNKGSFQQLVNQSTATKDIQEALHPLQRWETGYRIYSNSDVESDVEQQVYDILNKVNEIRERIGQVGPTKFNPESSRGHLFMVLQAFNPA